MYVDQSLNLEAKRLAEAMLKISQHLGPRIGKAHEWAAEECIENDNPWPLFHLRMLNKFPVTIEEFLDSPEFLGGQVQIWPKLREEIIAMAPDVWTGSTHNHEVLLGGATGTGKTTMSFALNAYHWYLVSCLKSPQRYFGMASVTDIVFAFMSVSMKVTERVIYGPLRKAIENMPYAKKHTNWDRYTVREMKFSNGVRLVPMLALHEAILGQNIIGGMIDEINFMSIIEKSKQVAGARGEGGFYDQAEIIYNETSRRRERTYQTPGINMGTLCVLSSTRYEDDFMDRRMREVQGDAKKTGVYVFRKRRFDVVPSANLSKTTFKFLVGSADYQPMIIEDDMVEGRDYPDGGTIMDVPDNFRDSFERDPAGAQRDILGVATDAISPFITNRVKIVDSIMRWRERDQILFVKKQNVNYGKDGMPAIEDDLLPYEDEMQRDHWVHVDLAISGDSCGIAIVRHEGFSAVNDPDDPTMVHNLPMFTVVGAFGIEPSKAHPIEVSAVRDWVLQLANYWGFNIRQISYDGFQSTESLQLIRKAGIRAKEVSVDRTVEPYMTLRDALYQNRIDMVDNDMLRHELSTLEFNAEKSIVDHPPKGSKDVADAVAGAVFAATSFPKIRSQIKSYRADGNRVRSPGFTKRNANRNRPLNLGRKA